MMDRQERDAVVQAMDDAYKDRLNSLLLALPCLWLGVRWP